MAGFSINEVNKLTFKVQAGGVIDASAGKRWYESTLAFEPNVKAPERILSQYQSIPSASSVADAQNAAIANPTIIQDDSSASNAIRLTQVYNLNNSTFVAYNTYNDPTSGFRRDWILPASRPQASGEPSGGYQITLWSGNPAGPGPFAQVFPTLGQGSQPEYVGWVFNYDQGLLFISDYLQTLISNPAYSFLFPGGFDFYITGFRYIGTSGGGGGSAIEIEDEGVSVTTDVKKIDFTGTGVSVIGSGTGNENIEVAITSGSGPQGTQGTQGIQGITGAGIQGIQGTQGLQGGGAQGIQGITGLQGTQGTQGITGSGTQGIQGITGLQGTQGLQGITGSGTQGIQGITGLQGIQGTQGLQGITGSGTQGIQGITGLQGTQGLQGITGSGTQGIQGITGLQGTQGTQGITGSGTQGIQGITGLQGTQGLQGIEGTGTQGIQGITGLQGTQGLQGIEGTGTQGIQGITGLQGTQGLQGIEGIGTQGIQGATGLQGASIQGIQGIQGITGSGTQGVQGITGLQGVQGISGSGSAITVANSVDDGSSPTFLSGTYSKFNFVDGDDNGTVFAIEDFNDNTQVNVFFPAPPPPVYPNYFNRNVATGAVSATVAEDNNPQSERIAIPNQPFAGVRDGGNFADGGWSNSNTLRSVYRQSTDEAILFGTGNTAAPIKVRGFGGIAGNGDSEIVVQVFDGDGTTVMDSHTITNITGNGTFVSTSGDIVITIADYNTIINPYNPQDVYEASIKVETIMGATNVAPGAAAGIFNNATQPRDGGKFTVQLDMTADTSGVAVDPPSPDLPASFSYTVFADGNPNTPNLSGTTVNNPVVTSASTKNISGITYYTNGTNIQVGVDGINLLNGNSINANNILLRLYDWSASTLNLSDTSYNTINGNLTTNVGLDNDWDGTDIDYLSNTNSFTIANSSYRFRSIGGEADVRVNDPWSGNVGPSTSGDRKLLIDVNSQTSTNTFEYFNGENQRLFRDSTGTTYSGWNSGLSLLDPAQPPNSRSASTVENLCYVGGQGIAASDFYADLGNSAQPATIISSDLSNYEPSGNPNYNTMGNTPIFHRLFGTSCVDFDLVFSGDSGVSANFTDALINNEMKIYVFPVGSNTNPALGPDPNTGSNYTFLPTYQDGAPGTAYPTNNGQYALALHGGYLSGAWSAGGWIPPGTIPIAYTGLDTIQTRMMKSTSSGNTGKFTFGNSSNVAVGGFYVEIQLIDRTIKLDQIQYIFVS